jgi:lycopene cyclase domain-containing protein
MSLTYFLINLAIILGPLCLTRDKNVAYYRHLPALGSSIFVVSSTYIGWDMLVTHWGDWSFNPRYVSGIQIVNLPLEEILFFVTVPYACLFIYEVVLLKSRKQNWNIPVGLLVAAFAMLVAGSVAYSNQGYTSKALGSCALFLALAAWLDQPLLKNRAYWLWLSICLIPFLIVNSILTALPVVQYHPDAIWGVRFITIPLEDFFYNYSLLSFYVLVYRLMKRKKGRPEPLRFLP